MGELREELKEIYEKLIKKHVKIIVEGKGLWGFTHPIYGYDIRKFYWDEEVYEAKLIKRKRRPIYLHIIYRIYLIFRFIFMVIRYVCAMFYLPWAYFKGTIHERHRIDMETQNYIIMYFIFLPAFMYWFNVYL